MASLKSFVCLAWFSNGFLALLDAAMATEYDRVIIFKEPVPDRALPGHVIATEWVTSESSCRVKCYLEDNCVSINVGPGKDGKQKCELNNATDESPSHAALEERPGYIHYAVENHCHDYLCPGRNTHCQVGFTVKGYRCVCREGYTGSQCEKDIDECQQEIHICGQDMIYVNEPGFFNCKKPSEYYSALGMETRGISDPQISASSEWDSVHSASQGRLNFQETRVKSGAWSARQNNLNQWLQVDLGNQNTKVTRVATQGRNRNVHWGGQHKQWVTKYMLQYSRDGESFLYYEGQERGVSNALEFTGNTDRDTAVYHDLNPPITARYIRFLPTAWHGHISMRVELYGFYGI